MARKSRKHVEGVEIKARVAELQKERVVKVGGYVRLSSDQEDNDSIETQILMIKQFIREYSNFDLVDIYSDEGYSGTNFARPDFERLMRDVYSGKIECIIVKDLSRFGRNYIEAGYYLETIFPNLGIRFISINDRFDTSREEDRVGMALPIKNMVNSMYAVDVSKKIIKNVELHYKLGDAKYRTTTYGYFVVQDGNSLIVDPEASRYVKLIFRWYLMGYSANQIAERLNLVGVQVPSVYKEQFTNRRSLSKSRVWSNMEIRNILSNPIYIGAKVNGKEQSRLSEHKRHMKVDPSNWIIHYGDHEPIIDEKDFELVQKRLYENRERNRKNREDVAPLGAMYKNSFAKRVICKDCGAVMQYMRKPNGTNRNGYQTSYYTCSIRKKALCRNVIYEDYLKTIVMDQIKNLIRYFGDQKADISALRDGRNEKSILLSNEKKLVYFKKKEVDIDELMINLYKDLAAGLVNESEYKALNGRYLKEKENVRSQIEEVNKMVFKMRKWIDTFENLGTKLSGCLNDSIDSQRLIDELIERVYYSNDGSIDIVYKCNDIIENYRCLKGDSDEEYSNVFKVVAT